MTTELVEGLKGCRTKLQISVRIIVPLFPLRSVVCLYSTVVWQTCSTLKLNKIINLTRNG